jgi:hypothetical protein
MSQIFNADRAPALEQHPADQRTCHGIDPPALQGRPQVRLGRAASSPATNGALPAAKSLLARSVVVLSDLVSDRFARRHESVDQRV